MKRISLFILLLCVLAVQSTWGQIPQTMSYQGIMKDANGALVSDGNYVLIFKLYDVETGGTVLWTETQTTAASDGIFDVILGSGTVLNLAFDKQYWLGVTVGTDSELSPRIKLASSPYSLNARDIADNAVTSVKIADGTITAADFDAGAVHSLDAADGAPVDAVYVDNDGNVGIGTPNPFSTLHIKGTDHTYLSIQSSGSGTQAGIEFFDDTGVNLWDIMSHNDHLTPVSRLGFWSSTTEVFTLLQNGNVGIGTTSPSTTLHVNGDGMILDSPDINNPPILVFNAGGGLFGSISGTAGNKLSIKGGSVLSLGGSSASGDDLFIDNSGNVGIGTTSPGTSLEIQSNAPHVRFTESDQSDKQWQVGGYNSGLNFEEGYGGTNIRMYIKEGGNVGVGTTSPAEKLDVAGTVQMTGFNLTTTPTSGYILTSNASGVGTWQAAPSGVTDHGALTGLADDDHTQYSLLGGRSGGQTITGGTTASENLVLRSTTDVTKGNVVLADDGGNVGIGMTAPTTRLDVEGDVRLYAASDHWRNVTVSGQSSGYVEINPWNYSITTRLHNEGPLGLSFVGTTSNHAFRIRSNNTDRIFIEAGGNVGIGTASPSYKLDVVGTLNLSSGSAFKINATDVLSGSSLGSGVIGSSLTSVGTITTGTWNASAIGVAYGGTGASSFTSNYLVKGNGTSALSSSLVYDNGTNVGIGTTSPAEKLDVQGNIKVLGNASSGNTGIDLQIGTSSSGKGGKVFILAGTAQNNQSTNHWGGDIEIRAGTGTNNSGGDFSIEGGRTSIWTLSTSPTKVDIYGGGIDGAPDVYGSSALVTVEGGKQLGANSADRSGGHILLLPGAGEGSGVSGNVGIGTASPSYKLDVVGTLNLSSGSTFKINGTDVLSASSLGSGVTGSSLTSVGTLTSGTWNASTIGVAYGGTGATNFTSNYLVKGNGTSTLSSSLVYDNGTNVGIGTTSPTKKLDVNGAGYFSGDLRVEGNLGVHTDPVAASHNNIFLYDEGTYSNPFIQVSGHNSGSIVLISRRVGETSGKDWKIKSGGGSVAYLDMFSIYNSDDGYCFVIRNGGNVGIGTMTPTKTLDVAGDVNISSGSAYGINGTDVLSGSALGSGITASSLTSVGTLTSGTWNATAVGVAYGGTGASTAADARTSLGLGSIATQASSSVSITGGSVTGITDLTVADGGTGASSFTSSYLVKGNGTSALSSSLVYDNGTNVGIGTTSPNSKLEINGSYATTAIRTESGNYTISATDHIILANTTSGQIITLPTAVGIAGRRYIIKKTGTDAIAVNIYVVSPQTIDGSTSDLIMTQWAWMEVISDGANWLKIGFGG